MELVFRGIEEKMKINEAIKELLASFYVGEGESQFMECFERSCRAFESTEEVQNLEIEKCKMNINARRKEAKIAKERGASPGTVARIKPRELSQRIIFNIFWRYQELREEYLEEL